MNVTYTFIKEVQNVKAMETEAMVAWWLLNNVLSANQRVECVCGRTHVCADKHSKTYGHFNARNSLSAPGSVWQWEESQRRH